MRYIATFLLATPLGFAAHFAGPDAHAAQVEPVKIVKLSASQLKAVDSGSRVRLKDPYSAVVTKIVAGRDAIGTLHVCGYINAKNSFGAYVGDVAFSGAIFEQNGKVVFARIGDVTEKGGIIAEALCRQRGLF